MGNLASQGHYRMEALLPGIPEVTWLGQSVSLQALVTAVPQPLSWEEKGLFLDGQDV